MASEGLFTKGKPTNALVQKNGVRGNAITCTNWYLVTTQYFNGDIVGVTSEYVGTTCVGCDGGMYESLCQGGESGGETPMIHYAKKYNRTWLVANINDLGIYKTNTFTIEDDYFIIALGFGPISKSDTDPSNALVEQVAAYAQTSADYTLAYTTCTAKITYPTDPDLPLILPEGSRNWTVPEIKNP